jgi:hypothetical protein
VVSDDGAGARSVEMYEEREIRVPAEHRLTMLPYYGRPRFTCTDCPEVVLTLPAEALKRIRSYGDIAKMAQRWHRAEMGVPG